MRERNVLNVRQHVAHRRTVDENNRSLEYGEASLLCKTFKTNPNARDAKGWNATAIATFRHAKARGPSPPCVRRVA